MSEIEVRRSYELHGNDAICSFCKKIVPEVEFIRPIRLREDDSDKPDYQLKRWVLCDDCAQDRYREYHPANGYKLSCNGILNIDEGK